MKLLAVTVPGALFYLVRQDRLLAAALSLSLPSVVAAAAVELQVHCTFKLPLSAARLPFFPAAEEERYRQRGGREKENIYPGEESAAAERPRDKWTL